MYIAIVKDEEKKHVYRACSKSYAGLTRTFLAMDSAPHINGLVFFGTNVDIPSTFAFRVISKGKVKKATMLDWANHESTLHEIVQYAGKHGAHDIEIQPNNKSHGKRKVQKHLE